MKRHKLIKISSFYPEYLTDFYNRRPQLRHAPYAQQYTALMQDCYGWSDFWKQNLEATGHFEVLEICANAEPLQRQWAKEHGLKTTPKNRLAEILLKQVSTFKPDIFFSHDQLIMTPQLRLQIRQDNPSIKLVIGYDGAEINNTALLAGCDLMLSCLKSSVAFYRSHGFMAEFFPHAFESSVLQKITLRPPIHNVSFVGGLSIRKGGHINRMHLLKDISKEVDISLWISGLGDTPIEYLRALYGRLNRNQFRFLREKDLFLLALKNRGQLFGRAMYQCLADSRITWNSHGDVGKSEAANVRLFEATGVGACLVTDAKETLGEYFEPGKEVITYQSAPECVEKLKYLLSNDAYAGQIAKAGQKRTLAEYTFLSRIKRLTPEILKLV